MGIICLWGSWQQVVENVHNIDIADQIVQKRVSVQVFTVKDFYIS